MVTHFSINASCLATSALVWIISALSVLFASPAFADDEGENDRHVRGFLKGIASWYGSKFHGRKTASGQIYNQNDFTCAHRTLPFGTRLLVKNPATGIECTVVVNDRGPYRGHRALDLSKAAARKLGITGVGKVLYRTGHYVAKKVDRDKDTDHQVASAEPTSIE